MSFVVLFFKLYFFSSLPPFFCILAPFFRHMFLFHLHHSIPPPSFFDLILASILPPPTHTHFLFLSFLLICSLFSKKKHCVIYGKWTECMWSVDPQAYEAHKKSEKKGDKKQKNVSNSGFFDLLHIFLSYISMSFFFFFS